MLVPAEKCALTSAALGPVYVNTPVELSYEKLPSPPESVALKSVLNKILLYAEPSFENCHLSEVSFHLNDVLVDVPLSTSIPAFALGVPVSLLFNTIRLSSTVSVSVFKIVCEPFTVKLPSTTKLLN